MVSKISSIFVAVHGLSICQRGKIAVVAVFVNGGMQGQKVCSEIVELETLWPNVKSRFKNEKDLSKRQDMVLSLRSRMNQMSNSLNSSQASNRSNLLGQDGRGEPKENNRTTGLDNSGIVGLQRQIMREQDDDLLKLEETVTSTKHIALAVNEELDLHTKLLDNLDDDTDRTNTRLKAMQRRLGVLGKKASSGCSVMCLILMVLLIVILVLVIIALIRYL
ncbi:hypothetical protein GOP47_0020736 [Adiantum capillus-veneris]|uniref:t-SNARE coiled-coil homology domain-containing protein n=1 Tax=Adiantum capillus-veneris TaxID=13818 RepID=A0A9D4UBL8_ADICA|nr:hypothetical protein GOP47_0020736 [Adiantum capillus-veneris]